MRRQDREITDRERLNELILACDCCRLGIACENGPYIVPLNFGYEEMEGHGVFYFHCAKEGRKLALLRANPHVGFELDTNHKVIAADQACGYSFLYSSVIGCGVITVVGETTAKKTALTKIMEHCSSRHDWAFTNTEAQSVTILRLDVTELTGKEHR